MTEIIEQNVNSRQRQFFPSWIGCLFYGIFLLLFVQFGPQKPKEFLFWLANCNFLWWWWLLSREPQRQNGLDPFRLLYLLMAMFQTTCSFWYYASLLDSLDGVNFGNALLDKSVLRMGAILLTGEKILLYLGYCWAAGIAGKTHMRCVLPSRDDAKYDSQHDRRLLQSGVTIYIISKISFLVNLISPLATFGYLLPLFMELGPAIAMMYIVFLPTRCPTAFRYVAGVILLIEGTLNLLSGNKTLLLLPLFPLLMTGLAQNSSRNLLFSPKMIAGIAVIVFLALTVVFPISFYSRMAQSFGQSLSFDDAVQIAVDGMTPGSEEWNKNFSFDGGAGDVISRLSLLKETAWSWEYVHKEKPIGAFFIKYGAIALIPRIVWPEKPQIVIGLFMRNLVQNNFLGDSSDDGTSINLSCGGAFYLAGGWWLYVAGTFLSGFLLFWFCLFAISHLDNVFGIIMFFQLSKAMFANFGVIDGGVMFYGQMLVLVVLTWGSHLVFSHKKFYFFKREVI